jgi:hypothetical protein
MTVINLQENGMILVVSKEGDEWIETDLMKKEMLNEFNISLDGLHTLTYEPDRKLFLIETAPGEVRSFNDPKENPILSKIDSKADQIIRYAKNRDIQSNLPPLHVIKDGKPYLPEQNREAYAKLLKTRRAISVLRDTAWALILADKYHLEIPEDIKEVIENALNYVSQEDIWHAARYNARIRTSPGSEARKKAGIEKDGLDSENVDPEENCGA